MSTELAPAQTRRKVAITPPLLGRAPRPRRGARAFMIACGPAAARTVLFLVDDMGGWLGCSRC